MSFLRMALTGGTVFLGGYILQTIYWENRVARYKRRASSNEGILTDKEMKEEQEVKNYLKSHCKPTMS